MNILKSKITFLSFLFLTLFFSMNAQTMLTPEQAVEMALRENLGLQIQKNAVEIAKTNDTRANAGMTPDVFLTAGDNISLNFTKQKFSNGNEINRNGAPANTFNAAATVNWTIFDGKRMISTKARFGKITELESIRLRQTSLDLTYQVLQNYWQIWRDRAQIRAIDELLRSTEERRRLAQTRLELGLGLKTDVLQAEIDVNNYQSQRLRQQNLVEQGKIRLATLLGNPKNIGFEVVEDLEKTPFPVLSEEVLETAPALLFFHKQLEINQLEQKEIASATKPRLAAVGSLSALRADNPANFITGNQNFAPVVGLGFSMPIYEGGRTKTRLAVADLQAKNIDLSKESTEIQLESNLKIAFSDFEFQQKALELESENLKLAAENLAISMERLRAAQTTSLEIRAAQLLFENAAARQNQALFALKSADILIKWTIGMF